jgi:hypothetical protein
MLQFRDRLLLPSAFALRASADAVALRAMSDKVGLNLPYALPKMSGMSDILCKRPL